MELEDIHPITPVKILKRNLSEKELKTELSIDEVSPLVGMSAQFIRRALDISNGNLKINQVLTLLDLDAFAETFVPRSTVIPYLLKLKSIKKRDAKTIELNDKNYPLLIQGNTLELLNALPKNSINCVVTSTPYWGTRIYEDGGVVEWADGEKCAFGSEQTPEGFIRHSTEILFNLKSILNLDGSIWWNLMDIYNTRTQIRSNASETLKAMNGGDKRSWKDYKCRRYSAGHSFLVDGEQCLIPSRVAERASRVGYLVKSIVYWKKDGSMPETVETRVTREAEYIIHLTLQRSPYFDKKSFLDLPKNLGGRNAKFEGGKLTDIWCLPTANGTDGHGAQFPISLPGRCISLSTRVNDVVLDPFVGSGTTCIAASVLNRKSIGFDISPTYLKIAKKRLEQNQLPLFDFDSKLPLSENCLQKIF